MALSLSNSFLQRNSPPPLSIKKTHPQINHPFYLGSRSANLIDADQVEKFRKKFGGDGGLDQFMQIPTLKGEIIIPPKRKAAGKGKKK
ncbi:putative ribosomal protein L31 [Helianthus annuus]|nr:putative ribosomal protein L31 [Helianthus annuus]